MNILITGSSGFIGSELSKRFLDMGYRVTGLDIQPGSVKMNNFIHTTLGCVLKKEVFYDTDLVIHAAYDTTPGSFRKNVEGTKQWHIQAQKAGAKRQLFFTSYSAHADAPSDYGKAKYLLEKYFLKHNELILRPGLVIGKGGSYDRLAQFLAQKKVVPILGGNAIKTAITHIDVLCQTITNFQSLEQGYVYNIFQPESIGLSDMANMIRKYHGASGVTFPVPIGISKILLKTAERLGIRLPNRYSDFMALLKSQEYGFESSYHKLGLNIEPIDQIVQKYC